MGFQDRERDHLEKRISLIFVDFLGIYGGDAHIHALKEETTTSTSRVRFLFSQTDAASFLPTLSFPLDFLERERDHVYLKKYLKKTILNLSFFTSRKKNRDIIRPQFSL